MINISGWWWLEHLDYFSHHIGRLSSSQLTIRHIFQRGRAQPLTSQNQLSAMEVDSPRVSWDEPIFWWFFFRHVVTSNDGNFSQNHVDVHKNSTTYDNKKIQEIEPQTSTAPLLKIVSFLPKWRHVWGFFYPFLDTCAESMAEVFRPQFVPIYSWMGNFYIIGVTTCLKRP